MFHIFNLHTIKNQSPIFGGPTASGDKDIILKGEKLFSPIFAGLINVAGEDANSILSI